MWPVSIELIASIIVVVISVFIYNKFFKVPGGTVHIVDDQSSNDQWSTTNGHQSNQSESDESDTDNSNNKQKQQLVFLWGSQSGTAETFAGDLADEAKSHGYKAKVYDIEQYPHEKLKNEKNVVFLQATYGEGDPTDNAMQFFEWLKSDELGEGSLTGVNYSVFALGNRQYEKFCGAGLYVDERLSELGAHRIHDVGMGDDDGSLSDDFDAWKDEFWKAVKNVSGDGGETNDDSSNREDSKFIAHYKFSSVNKSDYKSGIQNFKPSDTKHQHVCVPVVQNRELRKGNATDKDSSTRHIELDIRKSGVTYETGDNCYIWPANGMSLVQRVAKRFNVSDIEQIIEIKTLKGGKPDKLGIPSIISYNDLFTWYLDVNALSSTKIAKLLEQYCDKNDMKSMKQLKYWSTDGKKKFHEQKYSVIELLEVYSSIQVPLIDIIEVVPKLKARPYTISSSRAVQPDLISVTLSVAIDTNLPNNRRHEGTCTHYLRSLKPNEDRVWLYITPSTFRLPKPVSDERIDKCVPVIMIGPGTGIAPFRGFIHEINHIRNTQHKHIGPCVLFYGCRNSKLDYIYEDELTDASEKKLLQNLFLAFSRENKDTNAKRTYVQHLLHDNGKMIWSLLHDKTAYLYVCGGTAMGGAIRDTIVLLGEKYGNMTNQRAKEYLKELQDKKRYIAELWS